MNILSTSPEKNMEKGVVLVLHVPLQLTPVRFSIPRSVPKHQQWDFWTWKGTGHPCPLKRYNNRFNFILASLGISVSMLFSFVSSGGTTPGHLWEHGSAPVLCKKAPQDDHLLFWGQGCPLWERQNPGVHMVRASAFYFLSHIPALGKWF